MARITADQLAQVAGLIQVVSGLFPKKRKLRKLGELVANATKLQGPYADAREKVDVAADLGQAVTLTIEEVAALDAVMDAAGKLGGRVKRALPPSK